MNLEFIKPLAIGSITAVAIPSVVWLSLVLIGEHGPELVLAIPFLWLLGLTIMKAAEE